MRRTTAMASQTASCVVVRDARVVARPNGVLVPARSTTSSIAAWAMPSALARRSRWRTGRRAGSGRAHRPRRGRATGREGSVGRYEDVDDFDVVAARGPETDGVPGVDDLPVARLEECRHDLGAVGCHRHLVAVEHDARRGQPGALVAVADERPSAADEVSTVALGGAPDGAKTPFTTVSSPPVSRAPSCGRKEWARRRSRCSTHTRPTNRRDGRAPRWKRAPWVDPPRVHRGGAVGTGGRSRRPPAPSPPRREGGALARPPRPSAGALRRSGVRLHDRRVLAFASWSRSDDVLDISPVPLVMPVTRQWWGRASR